MGHSDWSRNSVYEAIITSREVIIAFEGFDIPSHGLLKHWEFPKLTIKSFLFGPKVVSRDGSQGITIDRKHGGFGDDRTWP